jgi:hypothetical protein
MRQSTGNRGMSGFQLGADTFRLRVVFKIAGAGEILLRRDNLLVIR